MIGEEVDFIKDVVCFRCRYRKFGIIIDIGYMKGFVYYL